MVDDQKSAKQARVVMAASVVWAVSIFLSRIMGLVREQIIGRTLGASRQADLYFASFTLPDFLNYLLGAGALSIVFIPIFLTHLQRGDEKRAWISFSIIANFIVLTGTVGIADPHEGPHRHIRKWRSASRPIRPSANWSRRERS